METLPPGSSIAIQTSKAGLVKLMIKRASVPEYETLLDKASRDRKIDIPRLTSGRMVEIGSLYPTAAQAKEAGTRYYLTDKPCNNGHEDIPRYTSNGACVMCARFTAALARSKWSDHWDMHKRFVLAVRDSDIVLDPSELCSIVDEVYKEGQDEGDPFDTFRTWLSDMPSDAAAEIKGRVVA